ncbi:hypothetical protein DV738_g608, partial [Chaetothyriales sp. CBS 135597]
MHEDLRRRALESGKTTSKKARSKQSSRESSKPTSRAGSHAASRVASRDGSDDEDGAGNLSDDTNQSINSIDALLEADDLNDQTPDVVKQQLTDSIADLLDRKSSNNKSREESLQTYVSCLTSHLLGDVLYGHVPALLAGFMKSVKAETSEREATLALRSIALTAISFADDTIYETVSATLLRSISDSQSNAVKTAAIYCLGICLTFGGADKAEISDKLVFLQEIASTDGAFVDADDNSDVVTAALQTYGLLATLIEDLEAESEDAVAVFLDQLDSTNVNVQVAAGENIALLYEKSYTQREEDDSSSDEETADGDDSDDDNNTGDPDLIKRYNAFHNTTEVLDRVSALSSLSTKSMSRRDKKQLHQAFASITMTVQNPRIGLQTNSSSRMTVRIHREGEMRVDHWWKLMRLHAIRRLLGGGFVNHYYEGNKKVLDTLPLIMREAGLYAPTSPRRAAVLNKGAKGRYRDSRRFVSGELGELL